MLSVAERMAVATGVSKVGKVSRRLFPRASPWGVGLEMRSCLPHDEFAGGGAFGGIYGDEVEPAGEAFGVDG